MSLYWQGVVEYNSKAQGTPRMVLMLLAGNANEEGRAWPSVADLAMRAGCGERAVQYALRQLEAMGELVRLTEHHGRPRQGAPASTYRNLWEIKVQDLHRVPGKGAPGGMEKVHPAAPEPSVIEPSSNGTNVPAGGATVTTHGTSRDADNNLVWSYCKARIWPNARAQPREKIALRLRTFTVDELKRVIDNFADAKWWMDRRDRLSAAWLFKSDTNVDRFLQLNVARDNRLRKAEEPRYSHDEGEQVQDFEVTDYVEQERQRLFGKGGD